jgi:hypothetical protein
MSPRPLFQQDPWYADFIGLLDQMDAATAAADTKAVTAQGLANGATSAAAAATAAAATAQGVADTAATTADDALLAAQTAQTEAATAVTAAQAAAADAGQAQTDAATAQTQAQSASAAALQAAADAAAAAAAAYSGGGLELANAERNTSFTSTNTTLGSVQAAHKVPGLSITIVGNGRPLDVEFGCPNACDGANADNSVGAYFVVDGLYGTYAGLARTSSPETAIGRELLLRRRIPTVDGVAMTIEVVGVCSPAEFPETDPQVNFRATEKAPMWLSAVAR